MADSNGATEGAASDLKGNEATSSQSTKPSRSRCFKLFKYSLLTTLIIIFITTLASTPWCIQLARSIMKDLNATSNLATVYSVTSGNDSTNSTVPAELTDTIMYSVVGVSLFVTLVYLTFGLIAVYRESFILSVIFGVSLIVFFAASICCYHHLIFLVNMIIDLILGSWVLLYAVLVKRADKLSPGGIEGGLDTAAKLPINNDTDDLESGKH